MEKKKLLTLLGSICLILVLTVLTFVAACAQPAPSPTPAPKPAPAPAPAPLPTAAPKPAPAPSPAAKPPAGWPSSLSIASTDPGKGIHATAVGIADVITRYIGIKTVPEPGSTGAKNIMLLRGKNVELSQVFGDECYDAARGLGDYKQYGKIDLRLLWLSSLPPPFTFVTRASTGITSSADLKGKKVMMIYQGSMTFTKMADLMLEAVGLTRNDVTAMPFSGLPEAMPALKEGRISAFIQAQPAKGLAGWLQEANLEAPMTLFSAPVDKLEALLTKYLYVEKCVLDSKTYGKITGDKDLVTISSSQGLYSRSDVPDDLIYTIMKTVFSHTEEINKFHAEAQTWTANPLAFKPLVPIHAGAVQFYKEKGLWTEKLEAAQKQLLAEVGAAK